MATGTSLLLMIDQAEHCNIIVNQCRYIKLGQDGSDRFERYEKTGERAL